jgi:hypothetical protein
MNRLILALLGEGGKRGLNGWLLASMEANKKMEGTKPICG